eukprot:403218_1
MAQSDILLGIILIFVSYILVIILIYGCYQFNSIQSLLIVQKRYPKLVLLEALTAIIYMGIGYPIWINGTYKMTSFGTPSTEYFIHHKLWLITIPVIHLIILTEAARLWLVSFDLHYLHSSKNEQWKSIIQHSFAQKDWYLTNRNKYGNQKYIITRVLLYYIFVIVFVLCSWMLNPSIAGFLDGIFYFVPIIVVLYTYYKCRKYNELYDNFLFYYEFRVTAIIWLLCFINYFIIQALGFGGFTTTHDTCIVLNGFFAFAAPSILSTLWIPKKIISLNVWNHDDDLLSMSDTNVMSIKRQKNANDEQHKTMSTQLYEILKNEERFELLMQWMHREFSEEAPLCFIEMVQFKEQFVEYMTDNMSNKDAADYAYIHLFYDAILKSSIVFAHVQNRNEEIETRMVRVGSVDSTDNSDVIQKFKDIAHSMFDKYIKNDAEFEINISAMLRMKYIQYEENNWNLDVEEFVNVFDAAIQEMFGFMKQSFIRYQQVYTAL